MSGVNNFDVGVLDRKEAAAALKVSPRTLTNWAYRGEGPRCVKIGGRILYRREDILDYIAGLEAVGGAR